MNGGGDHLRLRSGRAIDRSGRRRCGVCLEKVLNSELQRVLLRHGTCGMNGQFVGARCLSCQERMVRSYVQTSYADLTSSSSSSEEDVEYMDEVVGLARAMRSEIHDLVHHEAQLAGQSVEESERLARVLARYTEGLLNALETVGGEAGAALATGSSVRPIDLTAAEAEAAGAGAAFLLEED